MGIIFGYVFSMATPLNHHPVLDSPLSELHGISSDFIRISKNLGFKNIRQMTDRGWGELMRMDGFDYGWFNELVRYLDRHGLLDMLEKD
ncbi:hypothetical protein JHJ32_07455 [Parapedobacter sp. ISTM3]|uniref:hypothetical protein n=1 Tax=Parapedobacter sp. ISTM3 TaxID=2800130 RepID=UPI001908AA3A|nr:hypothetical protein [Parapedobacter sp. ISTM3]MBK1439814.1 hypothetical protein [Parapedobacter sp. ISTM3]